MEVVECIFYLGIYLFIINNEMLFVVICVELEIKFVCFYLYVEI